MHRARLGILPAILVSLGSAAFGNPILINEIMYNSPGPDDVEYIEIYNPGPDVQDLTGWYLLDDDNTHPHCNLVGSLDPGEYLVVAGFLNRFQPTYPGVTNLNSNQFDSAVTGQGWSLGNNGDRVRLFNQNNALKDSVLFGDVPPWPTQPDGAGPSLELRHPALDNAVASNWGASVNAPPEGTPGAVNSIFAANGAPLIQNVVRDIALPGAGVAVTVNARITDDSGLPVASLRVSTGAGFSSQPLFDDGAHGDGSAGDFVYGATIAPQVNGTVVRYYIEATDNLPQTSTYPASAPAAYLAYTAGYVAPQLVINEILASNVAGIVDEVGDHEDWLEIRNRGVTSVNVAGMFLTSNLLLPQKWPLPSAVIPPGGFLLVWCDDEAGEGPLHATFKLDRQGGKVGLFDTIDHGNGQLDGMAFGLHSPDVSFGYFPDDTDAPDYLSLPSPGFSNSSSAVFSAICIEEFQTTSLAGGTDDWVTFYNRGTAPIDISGWHLSDDTDFPLRYTFPTLPPIPAGGSRSVDEVALGFSFSSDGGEVIMLTHSDGVTGQDFYDYGPQTADISQGRFPEGSANWHYFSPPTRNTPNVCSNVAPLGPVSGLRFLSSSVATWNAVQNAQDYDLVRGSLLALRASGGNFAAAGILCLENNGDDLLTRDATIPAPATGYFYLARATNFSCGFGTYDSGFPSQVGGRDAEIGSSAGSCP